MESPSSRSSLGLSSNEVELGRRQSWTRRSVDVGIRGFSGVRVELNDCRVNERAISGVMEKHDSHGVRGT